MLENIALTLARFGSRAVSRRHTRLGGDVPAPSGLVMPIGTDSDSD